MAKLIVRGREVLLDQEVLIQLSTASYSIDDKGYCRVHKNGITEYLARIVLKAQAGQIVDHKNGIKLDNRRDNLRIVSYAENAWNSHKPFANNVSGFRGVYFHKPSAKWRARICKNGSNKHLGLFDTAEEASIAYQRAKSILHHIKEQS